MSPSGGSTVLPNYHSSNQIPTIPNTIRPRLSTIILRTKSHPTVRETAWNMLNLIAIVPTSVIPPATAWHTRSQLAAVRRINYFNLIPCPAKPNTYEFHSTRKLISKSSCISLETVLITILFTDILILYTSESKWYIILERDNNLHLYEHEKII